VGRYPASVLISTTRQAANYQTHGGGSRSPRRKVGRQFRDATLARRQHCAPSNHRGQTDMQYLRPSAIALASRGRWALARVTAYRLTGSEPAATCRAGASAYGPPRIAVRPGQAERPARSARRSGGAFLQEEVTPRFPDGLTVLTAYGQWRDRSGEISREPSRVLAIWYRRAADSEAAIEAIRQGLQDPVRPGERHARGRHVVCVVLRPNPGSDPLKARRQGARHCAPSVDLKKGYCGAMLALALQLGTANAAEVARSVGATQLNFPILMGHCLAEEINARDALFINRLATLFEELWECTPRVAIECSVRKRSGSAWTGNILDYSTITFLIQMFDPIMEGDKSVLRKQLCDSMRKQGRCDLCPSEGLSCEECERAERQYCGQ